MCSSILYIKNPILAKSIEKKLYDTPASYDLDPGMWNVEMYTDFEKKVGMEFRLVKQNTCTKRKRMSTLELLDKRFELLHDLLLSGQLEI